MHNAIKGTSSYLAISDPHSLNSFLCLEHLDHSLSLLPNPDSPKPTITKKTMSCWYQNFLQLTYPQVTVRCAFIMKYTLLYHPGRNEAINLRLKTLRTDQCKNVNITTEKILSLCVLVYCFIHLWQLNSVQQCQYYMQFKEAMVVRLLYLADILQANTNTLIINNN